MKQVRHHIDIEIDKLTNSIENIVTGDRFLTDVLLADKTDLKTVTKKNGWLFSWKAENKLPDRDVYKLTIKGNPSIIQGLISITEKEDHVYIHLIESAPFNLGKNKVLLEFLEILWLLLVEHPSIVGLKDMFPLEQKHN